MTGIAQHIRKLVTVITEASLERELTKELDKLGAAGYTISDVRGRGHHGERAATWGHSGNIRVETICDTPLAEKLLTTLRQKYYDNYAMVLFVNDGEVLRPDKFS